MENSSSSNLRCIESYIIDLALIVLFTKFIELYKEKKNSDQMFVDCL